MWNAINLVQDLNSCHHEHLRQVDFIIGSEYYKENLKKWNNPKFDESIMKLDVDVPTVITFFFKFVKSLAKLAMDVWWNCRRKERVYKKKRKIHNSIFSVLIFENIITLLSRGLMFEIVGFLKNITEDNKNNGRIFWKKRKNIQQIIYYLKVIHYRIL